MQIRWISKKAPKDCLKTLLLSLGFITAGSVAAQNADPFAANNGLYPTNEEWADSFRIPNLNYPKAPVVSDWSTPTGSDQLSLASAPDYAAAMKAYLEPTLRGMIDSPLAWDPKENNWFNMVWSGVGEKTMDGSTDPNSGRDSLLGSYTGQVMPADTFSPEHGPVDGSHVQNHAVVYYNATAASMLGQLWANIYDPDLSVISFAEGSIVVKAEASTSTPEQWPVLDGGALWHVYRPSTAAQACAQSGSNDCSSTPMDPQVLEVRALQLSIAVKDSIAAPETGWVFLAYTYDSNANGATPWDRFTPLGVQWGNDPELANSPTGRGEKGDASLQETWVNPAAPAFVLDTLGWGGRLAGPMDVATRHNVITTEGKRFQGANHLRVSSCMSCHGAAEYPMTTNLYPSPNKSFPPDGEPFLLFEPGSPEWAEWHQNRRGDEPMSLGKSEGVTALDYDWVILFSLNAYNAAVGNDMFVIDRFHVH